MGALLPRAPPPSSESRLPSHPSTMAAEGGTAWQRWGMPWQKGWTEPGRAEASKGGHSSDTWAPAAWRQG